MSEEKIIIELNDEELEKVAGGDETTMQTGTEEVTDKAVFENLQDNKGANE